MSRLKKTIRLSVEVKLLDRIIFYRDEKHPEVIKARRLLELLKERK